MQQGHESSPSSGSGFEEFIQYAHRDTCATDMAERDIYMGEMKNMLGKDPMLFQDSIDETWKHTSAKFQTGHYVRIFPTVKKYKTNQGVLVDFIRTELKVSTVNSMLRGGGSPVHTYDLAFLTAKSCCDKTEDFLQIPCWDKHNHGEKLQTIIIKDVDEDQLYFFADSDEDAFKRFQIDRIRRWILT